MTLTKISPELYRHQSSGHGGGTDVTVGKDWAVWDQWPGRQPLRHQVLTGRGRRTHSQPQTQGPTLLRWVSFTQPASNTRAYTAPVSVVYTITTKVTQITRLQLWYPHSRTNTFLYFFVVWHPHNRNSASNSMWHSHSKTDRIRYFPLCGIYITVIL